MKKLSIKDKAEEYGYTNWQSDEYHDGASEGLPFDAIGHTQKTFEAGANYVLEQIEEMLALKNQYTNKCDFCDDLEWRIEQLKK